MKSAKLVSEITSRKMRALAREREVLKRKYGELLEISESKEITLSEQFEQLYNRIKEMNQYHPDIENLEAIIKLSKLEGGVSDSLLKVWIDKLTNEAKTGQYKQLQGFIYGSILDEYIKSKKDEYAIKEMDFEIIPSIINDSNNNNNNSTNNKKQKQQHPLVLGKDADVFKTILSPSDPKQFNLNFPKTFFEKHPFVFKQTIVTACENVISQEVTQSEINSAAESLITRSTLKNDLRNSLIQLQNSTIIMNEYATEIQLMLSQLDSWNWLETDDDSEKKFYPSIFVKNHKNDKQRAYIDCNPLNAIFLEIVGKRWSNAIRYDLLRFYKSVYNFKHIHPGWETNTRIPYPKPGIEKALENHFSLIAPPKVLRKRSNQKTEYDGDNVDEVDENMIQYSLEEDIDNEIVESRNYILKYLSTQIKLVKSVIPNNELNIAQADIENCYPSISHPVLLEVLKQYGFNEKWLSFFSRYLKPMVTLPDGSLAQIERGVFLKQSLSLLFVELLLCLVDVSVKSSDKSTHGPHPMDLTYVRAVDDIYLWSLCRETTQTAWNTLDYTLKQLGMKLNLEKSSSALLSNTKLAHIPNIGARNTSIPTIKLPENDITFGFLILNKSTWKWDVNQKKVSDLVSKLYQRVNECPSIIGKTNIYNSYIKYIEHQLNKCSYSLGTDHIKKCIETFRSINNNFIEKGQTLINYFEKEIRKRFPVELESIPEVWYYWPMTAGGLGIQHPVLKYTVMLNSMVDTVFTESQAIDPIKKMSHQEYSRSLLWLCDINDNCYHTFDHIMSLSFDIPSPKMTDHLTKVIERFTSRFDYENNGRQSYNRRGYRNSNTNLSPYWKWIISTYDAQMVALFGDYSFTSSQVVPVSLIMEIKSSK